ncbi:hypothetical protein [Terriglobus roseus]|uniref:Uncharacterized protein n=1 Tax=Terriglobus roseus TaxID=392734 RepID=A0A1G7G606_9BACT|nr:hypothetical protein [Terriglobus roseus]SDE83537.1 hypothetical protein SAMN05444167_0567 [Terriglobus roseus]
MLALTVLGLLLSSAAGTPAQSTAPPVKGHTIGESVAEFVQKLGAESRARFQGCAAKAGTKEKVSIDCRNFQTVASSGGNGVIVCSNPRYNMDMCRDFEGVAGFSKNELVVLNLKITNTPWESALEDTVKKFGQPTETHVEVKQNLFGARWELRNTVWIASKYTVLLYEDVDPKATPSQFIRFTITDKKYIDEKKSNPAKSALD